MKRLEHAHELLDDPEHDDAELEQSLNHVAQVNRWLGGARAILRYATSFIATHGSTRILDVGTGSADLPRRLSDWARTHGRNVHIVAADAHPQMQRIAARRCRDYTEIVIEHADALSLPYADRSFDVTLLSMTLHHFDPREQLQVLREAVRVTTRVVIVNELRRTWLNYAGARFLAATLWRTNRLTRHDGPLSVRRSFTGSELVKLARQAGVEGRAHNHYFQRVVLVIDLQANA